MRRGRWHLVVLAALATLAASGRLAGQPASHDRPDWRRHRLPRIEQCPRPDLIRITHERHGWARVRGESGAAGDPRARCVRIVNLSTADRIAAPVRSDGSFDAALFAPPGSWLQINTLMLEPDGLPPAAAGQWQTRGFVSPADRFPAEQFDGMIGGHPSSSPAAIVAVAGAPRSPVRRFPFSKKTGKCQWLMGESRCSATEASPGDWISLDVRLTLVADPSAGDAAVPPSSPQFGPTLVRLFDETGRQRSVSRQPTSDVLTPTGLPIETHGEMVAERTFDGRRIGHLGGVGWGVEWHFEEKGTWRMVDQCPEIEQRLRVRVPPDAPAGRYQLWSEIRGLADEGFDSGEPISGPPCLAALRVGDPAPPRLSCLLFGSAATADGARGCIARTDSAHFAINTKISFTPAKIVLPRDDGLTGEPIVYALDPYLPKLSTAHRPVPAIPQPLINFDFAGSRLAVRITAPSGRVDRLGPAPLVVGQNDLSVLRPDLVHPGRVVPPVPPTYGNPSAADIYHVTGRGAFDHGFREYGHHTIQLDGRISDVLGNDYVVAGEYDVYLARPLDLEVFPELSTPLEPGVPLLPQVKVQPPLPADVSLRWRHYPGSDATRVIETRIAGTANRWGVFVPGTDAGLPSFDDPGEYVCDVDATYRGPDGVLWMGSRRGASVVVTPDSRVVVHGERGNRSPTARWRARWFRTEDNRFIAPPAAGREPPDVRADDSPHQRFNRIDLGHTCLPYEPGDVAWLGHTMAFSLFPGITFEDPVGTLADLLERRWPGVRWGEGREGLYPYALKPEDRRAIGELPFVCMTRDGRPPSVDPSRIDLWGYFYATSWRPGVAVRSLVAEDAQPVGYWFFDDPYAHQFGNGPHGDLSGDVKMNYAGGVFRDLDSGVTHYGAYASMLVLIDSSDQLGVRVMPPFDGRIPGSPRCGPLLEIGGTRYDAFITLASIGPATVLDTGDRLAVAGVVWPPISGHVAGTIISPSGVRFPYQTRANSMGLFDFHGPVADEPGLWTVSAEAVCTGATSCGIIAELVPESQWPRGGPLGLRGCAFFVPVVPADSEPMTFDIPAGSRATPPLPLVIRGHVPDGMRVESVEMVASLPGQVIDQRTLPVTEGVFETVYDPWVLRGRHPNLDTRIEVPHGGLEGAPAWFDTVTFVFWGGQGEAMTAGMVLVQGEEVFARAAPACRLPRLPADGFPPLRAEGKPPHAAERPAESPALSHAACSSLLLLNERADRLYAAHPWSGEVVRLDVERDGLHVTHSRYLGGCPRSMALSPDESSVFAVLEENRQVVAMDAESLDEQNRFDVRGTPRAVVAAGSGQSLYVADFDGDCVLRVDAASGAVEAISPPVNRPACLAVCRHSRLVYAASFRTGEIIVLDEACRLVRRLPAVPQLNQCTSITVGPDGLVYAPQTRSDTVVGGRMFDRSVFPVIAVADPRGDRVEVPYSPDLLVVPPHRPAAVAVGDETLYLASAGSDDVLALDIRSGFPRWHQRDVGLEPAAVALDGATGTLYVLTIAGQQIVRLDARTGAVLSRTTFANDKTPPSIARGRYLFGTATDKRLAKDQWMSCAVCHPDGDADGRQWDLGEGPLDTRSLRSCLEAAPLHFDGHLNDIAGTGQFARQIMAGQWFDATRIDDEPWRFRSDVAHPDLDALTQYIATLRFTDPPPPLSQDVLDRGREIFFSSATGCSDCHPPPFYTDSGRRDARGQFVFHDVGTRSAGDETPGRLLDTPTLLGLRRSEPYLHDGRAATIGEVFTKFNPRDRHGRTSHLNAADIRALAEYLRCLAPPAKAGVSSARH